jgi:NAD(P)-dependent dehydrogenase (short-subunit alcohol dehydrogenase family)
VIVTEDLWRGKVAVVTGAASGIGLALVRRFASEGMAVVMADRDAERVRDAADGVRAASAVDVLDVECDVRRADSVQALADRVAGSLGDVHVLCNNAGVIRPGRVWETTADDWSAIMDVNVLGTVNGITAFVPRMLAHGHTCHVVNTASAAGLFAAPSFAGYCVSKAAVVALSEALAAEVAELPEARLRVSVLCPGSVATNLFQAEVERRRGEGTGLSADTASRWSDRANPGRTDQVSPEIVADHVWTALQVPTFWILPMQSAMKSAALARLGDVEDALRSAAGLDGAPTEPGTLAQYYRLVDGAAPAAALELVADELEFCLTRPDRTIEGSRRDLAAYIEERAPLGHRLVRWASDGDVEFAVGESVDGDTALGTFIAAVRTDGSGRIDRYLAAFYPDRSFGPAPD